MSAPEQEKTHTEQGDAPGAPETNGAASKVSFATQLWDPQWCAHDQEYADAVLGRMAGGWRRLSDTRSSWIRRGEEAWEVVGDQSGWLVSFCARLMPLGDTSKPEKGQKPTPEQLQARRRARFMSNAGSAAIAAKIRAVTDGIHVCTAKLSDLDTEPEILWAGGLPYNLRASIEEPVVASPELLGYPAGLTDYGLIPHLKTASVAPNDLWPTPAWDAFVAAVWPDPAIRAWCLRVLSISLTGYPDAALPVLYGKAGTGKTSIATLLVELLGSYASAVDSSILSPNPSEFVIYTLKGLRLGFVDEGPREGRRSAEQLKQLTGGAPLRAGDKYEKAVPFRATHTMLMTSNDPPVLTEEALRRRVRVLPCEGDQAEVLAARVALAEVWADEAPGVLAMFMREAAAWLADRDSALVARAPQSVRDEHKDLEAEQDVVAQWVADMTIPSTEGTPARQLYQAFAAWFEGQAVYRRQTVPSMTRWGRRLTELGHDVSKRPDGKYRPLVLRS